MGIYKIVILTVVGITVILPLTRLSLLLVGVPEEEELVAGVFITIAYGLLGSPILALLAR